MKTSPIKDTLSLSKILKSCKMGDTFITAALDKEVSSYAHRVGCKVTTQRRQMINLNLVQEITIVTVIEPVEDSVKAKFPRRSKRKI